MAEQSTRMQWISTVVSDQGPPQPVTRHVLLTLATHMDSAGNCFPGIRLLAEETRLDESTVRRHLRTAVDGGWLSRHTVGAPNGGQGWRRYRYRALVPAEGAEPDSPRLGEGAGTEPARSGKGAGPLHEGAGPVPERCGSSARKVRAHVPLNPPIEPNHRTHPVTQGGHNAPNAPDNGTGQPDLLGTPQAGPPSRQRAKQSKGKDYPEAFERLWEERPRRAGGDPKPAAFRAWQARIREGRITEAQAHAKVLEYRRFCEATGKHGTETVQQLATFFGPVKEGYLQDWTPPRPAGPPGEPNRYHGLAAKDYGTTRGGILDDTSPLSSDGSAGPRPDQGDQSATETKASTTASRWGRGTHAGILADAVEGDQGGRGHG
ncbi:MAG: helix-turn-helix domain-containing protein [Ectothiorhodospiraceae bacterium]|nr:helix-turn-helix domain-containing protein [Ectothiorhodospiraceae bacterium]